MYLLNKQNLFVENIVIKKYLNIIKKKSWKNTVSDEKTLTIFIKNKKYLNPLDLFYIYQIFKRSR